MQKILNGETPFTLVFRMKGMILIKIGLLTFQTSKTGQDLNREYLEANLD